MKKILLLLGGFIVLIFVTAFLVLFIYRDDIQRQVDKAIAEYVDADVYYDPGSFSVSLFPHFPNPTVSLADFGVVCREPFAGDTLISVDRLQVTADLFSLFGDKMRLKAVDLSRPRIYVLVAEDQSANYDIIKSADEEANKEQQETESRFSLGIDSWSMSDGRILYDDRSLSFYLLLEDLDHRGRGDFTQDVFDMSTVTGVKKVVARYDGINYLNGQQVEAEVTMNMNLKDFVFTFKENKVRINDLGVSFSGSVAMPSDDIDLEMSFAAQDADIKSLYSLIPSVYTSDFNDIETSGTLALKGNVTGTYSETQMPGFSLTLKAENGRIKYPGLPKPVTGIALDMQMDSEDGKPEHTRVNIRTLKMTIGRDPVEAHLWLKNLRNYDMVADIRAKLDLKDLTAVFPMEDTELGGLFNIDLHAEGVVDTLKGLYPVIKADMKWQDGYFKNSLLSAPIEGIQLNTRISCPTGKIRDVIAEIDPLELAMGSDRFTARGTVANPEDYQWDIFAKGRLNLKAISEMIPLEGVHYEGMLTADVKTKGKFSDLEAGRYSKVPTSGRITLENLKYKDAGMPHPVIVTRASGSFSPERIAVEHLAGTAGRSDFSLSGTVDRYMNYIFGQNETIKGRLNLKSKLLDVDEWLAQTGGLAEGGGTDSVQLEMPEIPRDIDFEFVSDIGTIYYDNLTLERAHGLMSVHDGMLSLKGLSFETLGGSVTMDGKYDTRDPEMPGFAYTLHMKEISIPGAYEHFNTVKTFAPMAKAMDGHFHTDFEIKGKMQRDMTPVYKSLNGNGTIGITDALVKSSRIIDELNRLTGMGISSGNLHLNDIKILASMENGRAYVRPFNIRADSHEIRVSGSIGADGSLDYMLDTEVDAGVKGQQINALLASLSGKEADSTDTRVHLKIKVGGTYDHPRLSLASVASSNGRSELKAGAKEELAEASGQVKEEAKTQILEGIGHVLEGDTAALEEQSDSLKNIINNDILDDLGQKGEDIKNSLKNLFGKKKKNDQ